MQLDQTILENRVSYQESDFPGFLSINRCAEKLQSLKNSKLEDLTAEETFAKEILYFKLEMGKLNRSFSTCDSEVLNYKLAGGNITTEIQVRNKYVVVYVCMCIYLYLYLYSCIYYLFMCMYMYLCMYICICACLICGCLKMYFKMLIAVYAYYHAYNTIHIILHGNI